MNPRVRFAPSPTGNIHVGNIRVAIFNWLFAKHNQGQFLVRVEDTDKERNTQAAVDILFNCMNWLELNYDEKIFYQSSQREKHLNIAETLVLQKDAYRFQKDNGGEVIMFRLPQLDKPLDFIKWVGRIDRKVHSEFEIKINFSGFSFALISKKGKAIPQENMALTGFKGLKIYDINNKEIFDLDENLQEILMNKKEFKFSNVSKINFQRRTVKFQDIVKGELIKPLDSMKDIVLVKSNGDPLFHLANVCDDITQDITHIIRGDDHVENTYRHILLYYCMGKKIPVYGHLPMISNEQGKPYSKRDGDAFVSDFKNGGYLPEALFNFLVLLGWSPGKEEKITRQQMIKTFNLKAVKSTTAQMNLTKLFNFNSLYLQEKSFKEFLELIKPYIIDEIGYDEKKIIPVAKLMHSRTKLLTDAKTWKYFFSDNYEILVDKKRWNKALNYDYIPNTMIKLAKALESLDNFIVDDIKQVIEKITVVEGLVIGKLNLAVRLIITGVGGGADIFDTIALIGRESTVKRLRKFTLSNYLENH